MHRTVNTYNCRIWIKKNPHAYTEVPLHSPCITVWCDFTALFFFESTVQKLVTGTCYLQVLQEKVILHLLEHNILDTVTFMQHRAPPHITTEVKIFLRRTFTEEQLISHHCRYEWVPLHLPDLTPLDFWLQGYIIFRVYYNSEFSLVQLKDEIHQKISYIYLEMCWEGEVSLDTGR